MSFCDPLRGGECMTGTGGDGGPRGALLCLNLGGSMGSTGISCILMMRSLAPLLNAPPALLGTYLMYSASLRWLISGRATLAAEILPLTIFSSASCVSDVDLSTASSSGLATSISCAFLATSSLAVLWISVLCVRFCCRIASYFMFPEASIARATVPLPPRSPLRPMSMGYCATWISGKAPPSPKSSSARGTHPARLPCGGGSFLTGAGPWGFLTCGASSSSSHFDPLPVGCGRTDEILNPIDRIIKS
mmetsp:Transcript_10764/g.23026  ORF Transcript_10764/g.23026 Transcript_10764/m.23026 type:complete len:248 (-) Transcript_10764:84-827(-)